MNIANVFLVGGAARLFHLRGMLNDSFKKKSVCLPKDLDFVVIPQPIQVKTSTSSSDDDDYDLGSLSSFRSYEFDKIMEAVVERMRSNGYKNVSFDIQSPTKSRSRPMDNGLKGTLHNVFNHSKKSIDIDIFVMSSLNKYMCSVPFLCDCVAVETANRWPDKKTLRCLSTYRENFELFKDDGVYKLLIKANPRTNKFRLLGISDQAKHSRLEKHLRSLGQTDDEVVENVMDNLSIMWGLD